MHVKNSIGRIIGMLHVPALPGSPRNNLDLHAVIDWILKDASALASGPVDGFILENFGDVPFFPERVPPHTVAFMSVIGREVRRAFDLPLGINVLRNDARSAMAIAAAVSAQFIRVNVHGSARVTDQGIVQGRAHETLRYRALLGSDVRIFADVDSKHSAPLAMRPLREEVDEVVSRGCADAVIVSGPATGKETSIEDLRIAKQAAGAATPVFAGSGVHAGNGGAVLATADGVIVGTSLKKDGITSNPVDAAAVRAFMESIPR
jgi:membrane complex biogenesis BtpA family protein